MEMTFPHPIVRPSASAQVGHQALLAPAIARQVISRTARIVSLGARFARPGDSTDFIVQRIRYFGGHVKAGLAPSGAFWAARHMSVTAEAKDKQRVYHDASKNSKAHHSIGTITGEQFNQAGMEHRGPYD